MPAYPNGEARVLFPCISTAAGRYRRFAAYMLQGDRSVPARAMPPGGASLDNLRQIKSAIPPSRWPFFDFPPCPLLAILRLPTFPIR